MKISGVPCDVWTFLTSMEAQYDRLSWTLQKTGQRISLNLVWPVAMGDNRGFSKSAKLNEEPARETAPNAGNVTVTNRTKKKTKNKSPSQKKRDRQRYEDWKSHKAVSPCHSQTEECQQVSPVENEPVESTDSQQIDDMPRTLDSQNSISDFQDVCVDTPVGSEVICESKLSSQPSRVTRSMTANFNTTEDPCSTELDIPIQNNSAPFSWDWIPPPNYCWSCFKEVCLISDPNNYVEHKKLRENY